MAIDTERPFVPINVAVLTVSDTRTAADDRSGDTLAERVTGAGHTVIDRAIVQDEVASITSKLQEWIADENVDCIILSLIHI